MSCAETFTTGSPPRRAPLPVLPARHDRARVAGGQEYEVGYEAKKTGRSVPAVKKAIKKVGNSRKRVEKRLGR
jgi:hypothetical protein